jgi:hypothetical protein
MDTCDRIEGTLIDSLQFIGEFHKWKECRCILCQEIQRHNCKKPLKIADGKGGFYGFAVNVLHRL